MKRLVIAFSIVVLLIATFLVWITTRHEKADYLAIGNFVVLTLTLIVLAWYAYDTNALARVTSERWAREGVLGMEYGLELVGSRGDVGRTLVRIRNPSTLVVRAKLACNFRVYDQPVFAGPLYDGGDYWVLYPQQTSQGWFEINSLLQQTGKDIASALAESSTANRKVQLTMELSLEFRDELGAVRILPPRPHYFDFDRWAWIPRLGETS